MRRLPFFFLNIVPVGSCRATPINAVRRIPRLCTAELPERLALPRLSPPVFTKFDGLGQVLRRHQKGRKARRQGLGTGPKLDGGAVGIHAATSVCSTAATVCPMTSDRVIPSARAA